MVALDFVKMHGCGNDFVIIDIDNQPHLINDIDIKFISNRKIGIGCDQVVLLSQANDINNDIHVVFFNSDGSIAETCGNALRCIAKLLNDRNNKDCLNIETDHKVIKAFCNDVICVDMGEPDFNWSSMPISYCDTIKDVNLLTNDRPLIYYHNDLLNINIQINGQDLHMYAVVVPNPHVVIIKDNLDSLALNELGEYISTHDIFVNNTNVNIAEIIDKQTIKIRTWERGAGLTMACGSGSVATFAIAYKLGLVNFKDVNVINDGGIMQLTWCQHDNHILLSGEVEYSFTGNIILSQK